MGIKAEISHIFFPDDYNCICCGAEILPNESGLCPNCRLPLNTEYCVKCGAPFSSLSEYCGNCKQIEREFKAARSALIYDGGARKLIMRFKFENERWLAPCLARYMAKAFESGAELKAAEVIVPVPLSKERLKERGYNQALLLANELSRLINLPVMESALIKTRQTQSQSLSGAKERAENIRGAYALTDNATEIKNKTVLLVDDIITTGATAGECAHTLKKAKAAEVFVLAAAGTAYKVPLDLNSL